MKYEYFIVLGLQRTGTNWLQGIMMLNLEGRFGNRIYDHWKHLTPLGGNPQNWRSEMSLDRLNLRDDVFYVATDKPFDMWCESINRGHGGNFFNTHEHSLVFEQQTGKAKKQAMEEIWPAWDKWKDEQLDRPNFYYHTYMDWLMNWQEYLLEISEITGWKRKSDEWINPPKVSNSPDFDITRYIKNGKPCR